MCCPCICVNLKRKPNVWNSGKKQEKMNELQTKLSKLSGFFGSSHLQVTILKHLQTHHLTVFSNHHTAVTSLLLTQSLLQSLH